MHCRLTALVFLAFLPATARAADHPMAGVYYISNIAEDVPQYTAEQEKLNCAWSFSIQQKSGAWKIYVIDKPKFDGEGVLQYNVWMAGSCTMAADMSHDSCMLADGPKGEGAAPVLTSTIYGPLVGDAADVRFFETGDGAEKAIKAGDKTAGLQMRIRYCANNAEAFAPFLSPTLTTLDINGWSPLIIPKVTPENTMHMKKVLARISSGR